MTGRSALATPFRGGPPFFPRRRPHWEPCQVPQVPHSLNSRFYPHGWLCDRHSPWGLAGWPGPERPSPEPSTTRSP